MPSELKIALGKDEPSLNSKSTDAEATFTRAREKLAAGHLSAEDARYLNQLFTSMVATEKTMSW